MSILTSQPTNLNYLSPLGFKFTMNRTPMLSYFAQSVNVPNLTLGVAAISTPFSSIPLPGDKLSFAEISVVFRVDEDMKSWQEIYDWMYALGRPDNFDQYAPVAPPRDPNAAPGSVGPYSDAALVILSSASNPIMTVNFTDVFPTSLSDLTFDSRGSTVDYIECTANFSYRKYELVRL